MTTKLDRTILQGWDVLVVDDDLKSLDVARRILKHYGATVHTAENGQAGLALINQQRPRFIICDITMPVMDGWGFIQSLKDNRETAEIPAIALTAHAMVGDRERAIAAGYHNYLPKPLNPATFIHDLLTLLVDIPALNISLEG